MLLNAPPSLDPTIIAALIGLLGTITGAISTLILTRSRKLIKRISYAVISDTPIVSIREEIKGKVEIFLEEHLIPDARLVVIRVQNIGNIAVRPEDYFEPITFEFEGSVLSTDVIASDPNTFLKLKSTEQPVRVLGAKSIALSKILLNPKQAITISALLDGTVGHIKVKGRIVDGEVVTQS